MLAARRLDIFVPSGSLMKPASKKSLTD